MAAATSILRDRGIRALPEDAAGLLAELASSQQRAKAEEVWKLQLTLQWADLHTLDPSDHAPEACFTSPKTLAGEGSPVIDEFCIPELAALLGQTTDAVAAYLTEVVELAHRLPRLWDRVMAGEVAGWRARLIARATLPLTREAAAFVDAETHWCAGRLTPADLDRLLDTARIRYMPDLAHQVEQTSLDKRHVTIDTDQVGFDGTLHIEADVEIPDALAFAQAIAAGAEELRALGSTDTLDGRRATALGNLGRHQLALDLDTTDPDSTDQRRSSARTHVVLHVHLSADAITGPCGPGQALTAWVEETGRRTLTAEQVRAWCARPDATITVKPVIDLHTRLVTDGYRPTTRQREHIALRDSVCAFPWCSRPARRADADHVIPFDHDAEAEGRPQPGPTATDNLAALCRRHHRLKTFGRWRVEMPQPGVLIWTSPHGHRYRRDHTGTRPLPDPRP